MRSRMLKLVRTGVVCLLLGAIINFAVAWGLIGLNFTPNLQEAGFRWHLSTTKRLRAWTVLSSDSIGRLRVKSTWREGPQSAETWGGIAHRGDPDDAIVGWEELLRPAEEDRTGASFHHSRVVDAAGWPMLSLWCGVSAKQQCPFGFLTFSPTTHQDRIVVGGLELPPATGTGHPWNEPWQALPLCPLWPGCVVNTLFYACVLWVMFAVPAAHRLARGVLRRRRGVCERCGYDLRGLDKMCRQCPECGALPRAQT